MEFTLYLSVTLEILNANRNLIKGNIDLNSLVLVVIEIWRTTVRRGDGVSKTVPKSNHLIVILINTATNTTRVC